MKQVKEGTKQEVEEKKKLNRWKKKKKQMTRRNGPGERKE